MNELVEKWIADGKPVTYDFTGVPHEVKEYLLTSLQAEWNLRVFVETGTAMGDMTRVLAPLVDKVYTIEMMESYYNVARRNLASFGNVSCVLGDSAVELERIVDGLNDSALIYLDAHYSGPGTARGEKDTPIVRELRAVARSPYHHVVVIDDARLFAGEEYHTEEFADYPSREWIQSFIDESLQGYTLIHEADAFVLMPPEVEK